MYLVACSALFALASIHKPIRRECLIISVISMATGILPLLLSADGNVIYWLRAAITTLGAVALCRRRTLFGFYQASIYAMTLAVYAALAYDVAQYNLWVQAGYTGLGPIFLVWGETYGSLIYGLVTCQFAAFLPIIWTFVRPYISILNNSASNIFWGKGSFKR